MGIHRFTRSLLLYNFIGFILLCILYITLSSADEIFRIRIVPRENGNSQVKKLKPIRFPMPATVGPFTTKRDSLSCIQVNDIQHPISTQLIDLHVCLLQNITYYNTTQEQEEEQFNEPKGGILGVFRGWRINPVSLQYTEMIFDDGDICNTITNERYSFKLIIHPTDQIHTRAQIFDIKAISDCTFQATIKTYIPMHELIARSDILPSGIIGLSDPSETITKICGDTVCHYKSISSSIENVMTSIKALETVIEQINVQIQAKTAKASINIADGLLKSSVNIVEKSIEFLQYIEDLKINETQGCKKEIAMEPEADGLVIGQVSTLCKTELPSNINS